jgi:hypothetical protein
MAMKRKKKLDPVESALERIYRIVEKRLTSLPETEAMERLKAIDAAHSQALEPDSKTHAAHRATQDPSVLCRSNR